MPEAMRVKVTMQVEILVDGADGELPGAIGAAMRRVEMGTASHEVKQVTILAVSAERA